MSKLFAVLFSLILITSEAYAVEASKVEFDPTKTAFLVMDYQNDIIAMLPKEEQKPLLEKAALAVEKARQLNMQVIYVTVGFRDGYPEVSSKNKLFSMVKAMSILRNGSKGKEIASKVAPQKGEVVVTKSRVGPFSTTDLETVLRAKGIDTLILAGISTSGVVLSTFTWASDMDYRIIVASDLCMDMDSEVQNVLMHKIFPRQAHIATSAEVFAEK